MHALINEFKKEIQDTIHVLADKFANALVKDLPYDPNPLSSLEVKKSKLRFETENDLSNYLKRIAQALKNFITPLEELAPFETEIFTEDAVRELKQLNQNEVSVEKLALEALVNYNEEKTLKTILGLSDNAMKALYRIGAELYNTNHYQEAANVYTLLGLLDPKVPDYWFALGDAEYFNQALNNALFAYALAARADPSDPAPHFYAARCYEELKQYSFALNSLDILLLVIEDVPDQIEWAEKAQIFKNHLQELISQP